MKKQRFNPGRFWGFAAAPAFFLLAACSPLMTDSQRFPIISERVGHFAESKLRVEYGVLKDADTEKILCDMANQLLKGKERGAVTKVERVCILNTNWVNAMMCPNGTLFVTSGLLDLVETRDELAFILSHELSHVINLDVVTSRDKAEGSRARGAYAGALAGDIVIIALITAQAYAGQTSSNTDYVAIEKAFSAAGGEAFREIAFSGYSEDVELRADEEAARWSIEAGYDSGACLSVINKLQSVEVANGENYHSSLVNSKPGPAKRLEKLKETLPSSSAKKK